jgi:hypothetical protein
MGINFQNGGRVSVPMCELVSNWYATVIGFGRWTNS